MTPSLLGMINDSFPDFILQDRCPKIMPLDDFLAFFTVNENYTLYSINYN